MGSLYSSRFLSIFLIEKCFVVRLYMEPLMVPPRGTMEEHLRVLNFLRE